MKSFSQGIIVLLIVSLMINSFFFVGSTKAVTRLKYFDQSESNENLANSSLSIYDGWYKKPSSYQELVNWYKTLENSYPDYLEVFKANELYKTGKVAGNYDLYYVRITNESRGLHKPEVLFLGSPHGDETTGTIGMFWFADWLMRKTFTNEPSLEYSQSYLHWLLNNREIYFEISHNPYGFDKVQRYDAHGWDLNREADYDGPGSPTGGIWASVSGKTLVRFINNHTIRVGCDFHGGTRMLIYPWASTYTGLDGVSKITGMTYQNVPPDFDFFDASSLRLGSYIGDYGGDLNKDSVGTIREHIDYIVKGGLTPWAYAANIEKNPIQDPYVKDEVFGNYPGTGILWVTPEISNVKNPQEKYFGNDTIHGYGAEVRRFILHQTDLAQPYIRFLNVDSESVHYVKTGEPFQIQWQVNGSLVVDNTFLQWSLQPDPVSEFDWRSKDNDLNSQKLLGGTGWDDAENGSTTRFFYEESILFSEPGTYFVVAAAKVDQRYKTVSYPEIFGKNSYLRLIHERTNDTYFESINGSDGLEEIRGQEWWHSSIITIQVKDNDPPLKPKIIGKKIGDINEEQFFEIEFNDPNDDMIYLLIDWGNDNKTGWLGPFESGGSLNISHKYDDKGLVSMRVKAKDVFNDESEFSTFRFQMNKKSNVISSSFFELVLSKMEIISDFIYTMLAWN